MATGCSHIAHAVVGEVGHDVALFVQDNGAGRDLHHEVFAASTVTVVAGAVSAALGFDVRAEVEVQQGVDLRADLQDDVATVAAVAAIGPTERFEFFAVDGGTAVAAVTGDQVEHDAVDEAVHVFPFKI